MTQTVHTYSPSFLHLSCSLRMPTFEHEPWGLHLHMCCSQRHTGVASSASSGAGERACGAAISLAPKIGCELSQSCRHDTKVCNQKVAASNYWIYLLTHTHRRAP